MDVLARANALRAAGRSVVSLAVGQPSDPAPQIVRQAASNALVDGAHRLYGCSGPPRTAPRDRGPLPRPLRARRADRAGRRDDGFIGRLQPRLPCHVRSGRQGCHHGAGISGLSQHHEGVGDRGRRDRPRRCRLPDRGDARTRPRQGRPQRPAVREPGQSDRRGDPRQRAQDAGGRREEMGIGHLGRNLPPALLHGGRRHSACLRR